MRINAFEISRMVTVLVTVDVTAESSLLGAVGVWSSPSFVGKEAGEARLVGIVVWSPGRGRLIF